LRAERASQADAGFTDPVVSMVAQGDVAGLHSQFSGQPNTGGVMEREGGCLCGKVRYKLITDPVVSRVCWCRTCQHFSGNGTANAIFRTDGMEVFGEMRVFTSESDSGNVIDRKFCPHCGSHLFAESSARPGVTVVRLGTLDDPSSVRPTANIWVASAPAWACFDPDLEKFERQPLPPSHSGT
jgi:hypothetical protein